MYVGIISQMLVCGDIRTTTSCAKLTCHHAVHQIGALCVSSSYYIVVASISVPALNNAQSKIS